ncbi:MAG: hypothetical protein Q8N87_02015 [bacterium]|nr:hypothetical protein [bacterium]
MNKQKGISTTLSILLVLLLIVVVGGVVVHKYILPWESGVCGDGYCPTTPEGQPSSNEPSTTTEPGGEDETADSKTYRNEEYGFELLIPSYISEQESSNGILRGGGYNVVFMVVDLTQSHKDVITNIINIPDERLPDPKITKSLAQDYVGATNDHDILLNYDELRIHLMCYETEVCLREEIKTYQFLEINGYPALSFANGMYISVFANNKIYRFWFAGQNFLQNKEIFETIVKSFKLITK